MSIVWPSHLIAPGPVDTELFRNIPEHWRKRKLAEIPLHRAATLNPNGGDVMV
ncbi:MAG: hypothetical protein ACRDTS_22660 [Mycobacterium sp.]